MAGRKEAVDKLYASEEIYPEFLPELVKDELKKYHRIANAEIISRRCLHLEIRRFRMYSTYLNKWLNTETLSPRLVSNLYKLRKIIRLIAGFEEFNELWSRLHIIMEIDEAGLYLDIFRE
jgi:hypothetical protein